MPRMSSSPNPFPGASALEQLVHQFTDAHARYGDGRNLLIGIIPFAPTAGLGPITYELADPPACFPPTHLPKGWYGPVGHGTIADNAGHLHPVLTLIGGAGVAPPEGALMFVGLARRAGALCYSLPDGLALAGGDSNLPELTWYHTLYAYLKGTDFVFEGPGYSRMHNLFAASVTVLRRIRDWCEGRPGPALAGCLRPGVPDVEGQADFRNLRPMTPAEHAEALAAEQRATPHTPPAEAGEKQGEGRPPAAPEKGTGGQEERTPAPAVHRPQPTSTPRAKKSTKRGDADAKLVAALTAHHKYHNGSVGHLEYIGSNALARKADVAKRSAHRFFENRFEGHDKYQRMCKDAHSLAAALKAINGEFQPFEFYSARSPDEVEASDE